MIPWKLEIFLSMLRQILFLIIMTGFLGKSFNLARIHLTFVLCNQRLISSFQVWKVIIHIFKYENWFKYSPWGKMRTSFKNMIFFWNLWIGSRSAINIGESLLLFPLDRGKIRHKIHYFLNMKIGTALSIEIWGVW